MSGTELHWGPLPSPPVAVDRRAAHVVRAALDCEPPDASRLLSVEEAGRAAALRSPEGRRRFVAAHAVLRQVLGRYLDTEPESIQLERRENGKPALVHPPSAVRFNLSHSGDVALIAVALGREVGVDVERIRPRRDVVRLAARALEPAAADELARLPAPARLAAFHRMWARHEAAVKCEGTGLSGPSPAMALQLFDLDVGPGFAAALAVEGESEVALSLFAARP